MMLGLLVLSTGLLAAQQTPTGTGPWVFGFDGPDGWTPFSDWNSCPGCVDPVTVSSAWRVEGADVRGYLILRLTAPLWIAQVDIETRTSTDGFWDVYLLRDATGQNSQQVSGSRVTGHAQGEQRWSTAFETVLADAVVIGWGCVCATQMDLLSVTLYVSASPPAATATPIAIDPPTPGGLPTYSIAQPVLPQIQALEVQAAAPACSTTITSSYAIVAPTTVNNSAVDLYTAIAKAHEAGSASLPEHLPLPAHHRIPVDPRARQPLPVLPARP